SSLRKSLASSMGSGRRSARQNLLWRPETKASLAVRRSSLEKAPNAGKGCAWPTTNDERRFCVSSLSLGIPTKSSCGSTPAKFCNSSVSRNSCAFSAREAKRAQICSSRRFSRKASGSSNTMGYSNSTASSNTAGASTGTNVREAAPRASFCRRNPSCPRRSLKAISGNAASARRFRTPQRSRVSIRRVSSKRADSSCLSFSFFLASLDLFSPANKTSTGRDPKTSLSFPDGITVTPENPRDASTAASGFDATATFASSPRSAARRKRLRAIEQSGMGCVLLQRRPRTQRQLGTQLRLSLRHAGHDADAACALAHGKNFFQRRFAFKDGYGPRPQLRLRAQDRGHREIRNEDAGKRHKNIW